MMKVLIVEDEKMAQASLARTLSTQFTDLEVIGMTSSVTDTIGWLETPGNRPDIIFMDVELSDGDCFEIFRRCNVDASVIMTTAYDKYAIKAFEEGSVDYLLKPIDPQALQRAVSRCRQRVAKVDMEALLKALGGARKPSYKERWVVRLGDNIIPVATSSIICFCSEEKANYIITNNLERYIVDLSMDTIAEELDPESFFRISRGCIISRSAIKGITRGISGKLHITTEPAAPCVTTVSRARVDDFLKWLE